MTKRRPTTHRAPPAGACDPAVTRRALGNLVEALWHGARDLAVATGDPLAIKIARIAFALSWATERGDFKSLGGKDGPNTWARRFLRSPKVLAENPGATTLDPFRETRDGETKTAAEELLAFSEETISRPRRARDTRGAHIPPHVDLAYALDRFLRMTMTGAMLRQAVPPDSLERLTHALAHVYLNDPEEIATIALRVYGVADVADVFKYREIALKRDAAKG